MLKMVSIMSNPSEDSQGTQLRVNKKLPTVCSGKRSRFSKPRPNLSISKRGETNIPSNAGKTSRKPEPEVRQTVLDLKTEPIDKTLNKDIQNHSSDADIYSKKTIEDNIKALSDDNIFKSPHKKDIEVSSYEDQKREKGNEENIEVLSHHDVIKNVGEDTIENVPYEDTNKIVSEQCNQLIASTNSEILDTEEISGFSDNIEYQISNTENLSPVEESQAISNSDRDNTSKDCDIETSPVKNSGTPLKSSESEKRSTSNITPTVIDKSKYPHLTSILSKKRTEPKKEAQQKRRRKFKKGDAPPERSKMTMADLIYWNPAKTNEPPKSTVTEIETPSRNIIIEEEENADDFFEGENNIIDSVPKLVISEDGQINIDQSSLFVSRNIPQPTTTEVVRKDDTTYSSFRKRPLTKHWTSKDTANFYRALSLVGADFSLMEQIFPNRTRRELKQKFKREEKFNIDLINKVLYESQTFDEHTLNAFIDQNNEVDDPVPINEKDADLVKEKSRKKRTSKKIVSTNNENCDSSIDSLVEKTTLENENKKKKKKQVKAKKLSDDEDVDIIVADSNNDNAELKSSKRKRCAKRLPDDFISLDSIEELKIWSDDESNNEEISDASEKEDSLESQENDNETEGGNGIQTENINSTETENNSTETENNKEEISESACVILNKIMNGTEIIDNEQNIKKKVCDTTVTLPVITNHDEEYISVEYIKNDDSEADLCILNDVVAYEVVNTQTAPPKKRRKINSISPLKSRDYFLSTKISPANYTNYTPV